MSKGEKSSTTSAISKTKDVVSEKRNMSSRRKLVIGIFSACLIILIAGLLAVFSYKKKDYTSTDMVFACKSDQKLINDFREALRSDSIKSLQEMADKVKTKPGYDKDPNCLYIILESDIKNGIYNNAKGDYDNLIRLNQERPGVLLEDINNGVGVNFEVLASKMEFLKKLDEQVQKNNINQFINPADAGNE